MISGCIVKNNPRNMNAKVTLFKEVHSGRIKILSYSPI